MRKIEASGSFYKKDSCGYLINTTSIKNIPDAYNECIEEIKNIYLETFPNLDSVYLRGSLAEGKARFGFSDIDTFVVLKYKPSNKQIVKLKKYSEELTDNFLYDTKIDLEYNYINQILYDVDFKFMQTVIKVQSLIIYGDNTFQDSLKSSKPDSSLISTIFNLSSRVDFGFSKIKNAKSNKDIRYWCAWISRTMIRCCLELVIDKHNEYTRDLYLCYKVFCIYYPKKENMAKQVLFLAINPTSKIYEFSSLLKDFSNWLIIEAQKTYPERSIILNKPLSSKYIKYEK